MSVIVDLFKILRESGLLTAAFIIGAIAVFVAIVGNIKTIMELSPSRAFALAVFGIALMGLSVGGYFISIQATSGDIPPKAATSTAGVVSTYTPYPTVTSLPNPTVALPTAPSVPPGVMPLPPTATRLPATATSAPTQPPAPPPIKVIQCIATPHTGLAQGNHTFVGAVHIAELWRADRQSPWGDRLVTAVVYGNLNIVNAGGSVWTYPAGCEDAAKRDANDAVKRTGAQLVTESELRAAGMIK